MRINKFNIMHKFLFAFVLFYCNSIISQTTTYSVKAKLNLKDAMGFSNINSFGIATQTSDSDAKATVNLKTEQSVSFSYMDNIIKKYNGQLILYSAFVTGNNPLITHTALSRNYYYHKWYSYIQFLTNTYQVVKNKPSDSRDYIQSMLRLAYTTIAEKDQGTLNWFFFNADPTIDVIIELNLENGMQLADVLQVKLPGLPVLFPKDFIEKDLYHANHYCATAPAGDPVCESLNRVRAIQDLNKIDFILQAHRGLWGAKDGVNENTMGAFIAAKNAGYDLVEFDLLPVAVPGGGAYYDEHSAYPGDMATFHEYKLSRLTSETDDNKRIYNETRAYLKQLNVKASRSETGYNNPPQKIMFLDEIVYYATQNNLVVCLDIKNLFKNPDSYACIPYFDYPSNPANQDIRKSELCDYNPERADISRINDIKFTINKIYSMNPDYLKNFAIKTYSTYTDLYDKVTTGINPVSPEVFHKVLWVPIIAENNMWQVDEKSYPDPVTNPYDVNKIKKYLEDWLPHNRTVLYYEPNFFNSFDKKTSVLLEDVYTFTNDTGLESVNFLEYVYQMTGRRTGLFSQEPSGGKGTIDFWGNWMMQNFSTDRRSDHIWLLNTPFFKQGVITTERPDQWQQLNAIPQN